MGFFDGIVKAVTGIPGQIIGGLGDVATSFLGNHFKFLREKSTHDSFRS